MFAWWIARVGRNFWGSSHKGLYEETGLKVEKENLILIGVASGKNRKNSYPNGDKVYNNTVLYLVTKYSGKLNCDYEELTDKNNGILFPQKESKSLKFYSINNLPDKLMDKDLIEMYLKFKNRE